ncbi:MAG: methylated-DNA--[protein]-cysteine S-methyltransferase [Chloroflexaceae bacterium]
MDIYYTIINSPLGWLLVAATGRGLCRIAFGEDVAALESGLRRARPRARIVRDDARLAAIATGLTGYLAGHGPCPDVPLDLRGTPFQRRVWETLRTIPHGETRSYGQIAAALGLGPGAARAVGRACAANPLALVVPCHRAVGSDGSLQGFRWGVERKRALLAIERKA